MKATAALVAAAVVAALAPAAAWEEAGGCSAPGAAGDSCAAGGAAAPKDDGAKVFGVEFFQLQVAMPGEENGTGAAAAPAEALGARAKETSLIGKSTARHAKGQFLDRVKKRMEGRRFRGNLTAALARQRQIPFIDDVVGSVTDAVDSVTGAVGDAVGSAVDSVNSVAGSLYNTTFITIALAINATLDVVQDKAVDLLNECVHFRDALLESTRRASSSAWDALSSSLINWIGTFMKYWVPAVESLQLAVPILTETLSGFGYDSVAVPFSQTMASVLDIADEITLQLTNTSAIVAQVASAENASTAQLDAALAQIENATNYAVAQATVFGDELQAALMDLIFDLARQITGVNITAAQVANGPPGTVEASIADLDKQVQNITDTFTTALDSAFTGINEAAAVATKKDSGGAAEPAGLLLPLLCGLAAILLPDRS